MPKTKKTTKKKKAAKSKPSKIKKAAKTKKAARPKPKKAIRKKAVRRERPRSQSGPNEVASSATVPGPNSGGQSGDTEGLSDIESGDSESVEELVEEGQDLEAELVDAVENAPDPDEAEISTAVPEDDFEPDNGSFSKRNRL